MYIFLLKHTHTFTRVFMQPISRSICRLVGLHTPQPTGCLPHCSSAHICIYIHKSVGPTSLAGLGSSRPTNRASRTLSVIFARAYVYIYDVSLGARVAINRRFSPKHNIRTICVLMGTENARAIQYNRCWLECDEARVAARWRWRRHYEQAAPIRDT